MMRAKISPSAATGQNAPITLHNAVASFAIPVAAGGGADVSPWRDNAGMGPTDVDIQIMGSVATSIPGPVGLYGEKDDGTVELIGKLNGGNAIPIASSVVGYGEQVSGVGIFKRLYLGGINGVVTPAPASNITVKATPILVAQSMQ